MIDSSVGGAAGPPAFWSISSRRFLPWPTCSAHPPPGPVGRQAYRDFWPSPEAPLKPFRCKSEGVVKKNADWGRKDDGSLCEKFAFSGRRRAGQQHTVLIGSSCLPSLARCYQLVVACYRLGWFSKAVFRTAGIPTAEPTGLEDIEPLAYVDVGTRGGCNGTCLVEETAAEMDSPGAVSPILLIFSAKYSNCHLDEIW